MTVATEPDVIQVNYADAVRLDKRLRQLVERMDNNFAQLTALVAEAKRGEIHLHAGFQSWTAYVADVFTPKTSLQRDQRRELVGYLSGEGMSQRDIAQIAGVGVGTVNRDLAASPVPNGTPEQPITGHDGKTYKRKPTPKRRPPTHCHDSLLNDLSKVLDAVIAEYEGFTEEQKSRLDDLLYDAEVWITKQHKAVA